MKPEQHIYTVGKLNREIRTILERKYPFISVSGEISNVSKPFSGHLYFTLKDDSSQIKAVLFKMQQRYLTAPLEDGRQVICKGRISVYEPRGNYQLIIDTVDFHGSGELQAAYERLKRRLAAEGLFAASLKKKMPPLPGHITLVTSPLGAAVHDFIQISTRRSSLTSISVYPVSVQGKQAPDEIAHAVDEINRLNRTDIIVLCRGGGSIEDLCAFNDENLARTIFRSAIPVVSAVGHETDFTIADFVSDLRAPTPSAAAELLTPDTEEYRRQINVMKGSLNTALKKVLTGYQYRLLYQYQRLSTMPRPLDTLVLRVSQLAMKQERVILAQLTAKAEAVHKAARILEGHSPAVKLPLQQQKVISLQKRLKTAINTLLQHKRHQYTTTVSVLDAVSPLATLSRGYAIAIKEKPAGGIITDPRDVCAGEKFSLQVKHGTIPCRAEG
ncbi:MAG: exodeoxyribonuclease VII large subunit [Desulfobulbus propionicus]|nr:MAG: exodeoxyribonuclease VII large subunit [Desulfobulbus propionicus]